MVEWSTQEFLKSRKNWLCKAVRENWAGKADHTQKSSEGETSQIVAQKMGIGSKDTYRKEKFISDNRSTLTPENFADWDEGRLSTNKA